MFGRKATRLAPAATGPTNTRIANHFRRPQIASTASSGGRLRISSAIPGFLALRLDPALRNHDDVAVAQVEVFLLAGDLLVVERNPLHRLAVGLKDDDARRRGELREPAGQGEDVEHRHPAL